MESVRLTLFHFFLAAGIVAGSPAFACTSSAQSAPVGNLWAAPPEARAANGLSPDLPPPMSRAGGPIDAHPWA